MAAVKPLQDKFSQRIKPRRAASAVITNILLWAAVVFFILPLLWTISTSLKPPKEYYTSPPYLIPKHPTIYHYFEALAPDLIPQNFDEAAAYWVEEAAGRTNPVTPAILNSLIVTLASTVLAMVLGMPASYALSRYDFKGGKNLATWLLSTRMIPPIVTVIPFFFIISSLKLVDKPQGLIILYIMINLPIVVWIMKGVFDEVPRELEEAALVDGANWLLTFVRVVLPLAIGGIVATFMFCVFLTWNEFLFALIMTRKEAVTMPVALATFKQDRGILWGMMSASIMVSILPVIAMIFVMQKRIVQGLLTGSSK